MSSVVRQALASVRRRCRWRRAIRLALAGLACGAAGALNLLWCGRPGVALLVLTAAPSAGAVAGLLYPPRWQAVATLVDEGSQLRDRTVAALEFESCPNPGEFHRLQVADALRHLGTVSPAALVPLRVPRYWPAPALVALVALAMSLAGLFQPPATAELSPPPDVILDEAQRIAERAEVLQREADAIPEEELKERLERLAQQRREVAELMAQPCLDGEAAIRQALRKIAELQAAIEETVRELQCDYDVDVAEGTLQDFGKAMGCAEELEGAGRSLEQGRHGDAAKALDGDVKSPADTRRAEQAANQMKEAAQRAEKQGQGRLSKAMSNMATNLPNRPDLFKRGTQEMRDEIRKHERRRRVNELLAREQRWLEECKSRCESAMRNLLRNPPSGSKGGSGSSGAQSKGGGGKNWGRGSNHSEKPESGPSARKLEQIRGQPGFGPADMEQENTPDGPLAQPQPPLPERELRKFQQESKEALEREDYPLSYRLTIQKYFQQLVPKAKPPDGNP
jgi:hypothetical protein